MRQPGYGVRIAGSGSIVPDRVVTNKDLERLVNTSDEWIVQRTGIRERRMCDPEKGEGVLSMGTESLRRALDDAGLKGSDLDLVIVATITGEMSCPSSACRIAHNLGATPAGAFDIAAACSGFVYGLNIAESMIRSGCYRTIGVVGSEALSQITDYTNRQSCILFGDAAGAVVLQRDDNREIGCLDQVMYADGGGGSELYLPREIRDVPAGADWSDVKLGCLQMNGAEIYKFAVVKFQDIIIEVLKRNDLTVDDIKVVVAHQSNGRIIESTRRRLGLDNNKIYVNIDRYGNSSAGSVPLGFDELRRAGQIETGDLVIFVAFGGGLTWAASLWRV